MGPPQASRTQQAPGKVPPTPSPVPATQDAEGCVSTRHQSERGEQLGRAPGWGVAGTGCGHRESRLYSGEARLPSQDRTVPQEGPSPAGASGLPSRQQPGGGSCSLHTLAPAALGAASSSPGRGGRLACIFTAITTEMSSFSSSLKTTSFFKVRLHNLQGHRQAQQCPCPPTHLSGAHAPHPPRAFLDHQLHLHPVWATQSQKDGVRPEGGPGGHACTPTRSLGPQRTDQEGE